MIDMHTHCFPDELAPRALGKTNIYGTYETDASVGGQLALAHKEHVRKFIILHTAFRPDSMTHVNDFAVKVNHRENIVISFGSVHPHAPNAVEEVERLYSMGIRGIKFQPTRQCFYIDEPCCAPVFRKIGELGMMTTIHGGGSARTKDYPVLPSALAKCIDYFGGATVNFAHMGGMFVSDEERRLAASLPIVTDTALCARHLTQDGFNRALDLFGIERVMFGTDMPWASMAVETGYINNAPITAAEKELIFDGNAARYLTECGAMAPEEEVLTEQDLVERYDYLDIPSLLHRDGCG